ncbi:unnamed protein product [Cochlearia groenlandica]
MDQAELCRIFQMFDRNGDGKITKQELSDSLENLGIYIPDRDMVQMIEKNQDGFIAVDELRSVLASFKQGRLLEDCKRMISKVDVDGDGLVNFKEFKHMVKGGGFAAIESSL